MLIALNDSLSPRLITRKYIKKIVRIQQEAGMNAASFLEERLNHIAMVKMSNRENDEVESYNRMQDQLLELGTRSAFANGLSMGTMFFLSTGSLCSILLTGGKAVEAKIMDHGQLVSFGTYSFLLALGSAGVVKALGEFQQGRQAAARVYRLIGQVEESGIEEKDAIVPTTSVVHFSSARHLKVNNLYFAYQNDPTIEILQDVSLTLSRGEVVAMVGKNGAGKSTVAMILAGMYKPKSGSILVEHDNATSVERNRCDYVRDLQRVEQSKLVQVVPQHPAIFGATILDNVRYARPEASEQEVVEALKAANAEQFVSTLEGGLMYQVGRNGSRLSGGQRQRLGLARALLANPVFLILDEPTSSLDSEGESAVADAVTACRESDRSLLVITHRAKTVTLADRIVVLKEGRIAEQGTFLKLQQQQGELFRLMPDLL
jgi:ABC-type multidrug transport system fused ATPase/permease subunit